MINLIIKGKITHCWKSYTTTLARKILGEQVIFELTCLKPNYLDTMVEFDDDIFNFITPTDGFTDDEIEKVYEFMCDEFTREFSELLDYREIDEMREYED